VKEGKKERSKPTKTKTDIYVESVRVSEIVREENEKQGAYAI
jgi:hypothetical protein